MHCETMTITPEIAARWLGEKNHRNRNISQRKVDAYADDIVSGRWAATHQNAIAFYQDGNLADGQHRLAAIAKAGRPLDLTVWWGLDAKAAYGIDAHRMRATHDQIKIAGGDDWVDRDVIATARMMMASAKGNTGVVSPQKIVEFCRSHEAALTFAKDHLPKSRSVSAPIRAALATAFYYEDHSCLADWAETMVTGVGAVPLSKTVLCLRERILREDGLRNGGGKIREYLVRVSMRSIEAYCSGQVLTKLYEPKERIYEIPS